jgi:glycosyltransferase involved in cell wall biosynthesis
VKIAIVVQRYGADINGGAELHARYIAEHLAPHVQVDVLTTCASDYITWRNALPPGVATVNGIPVRRFAVARERDPLEFGRHSERVFTQTHALRDELAWLDAEGPTSPDLVAYIAAHEREYDFFIFFSFRYYHAYYGVRAVAGKAILVPTAERDGALGLTMFGPIFRGVRALMYNSHEERTLIQSVAGNRDVPGVVVGVGSAIPEHTSLSRFRQKFGIRDRFAIYVGRIDENKGCAELFDYFQRYTRLFAEGVHLVLVGQPIIPIPEHPKIHHLGFLNDEDKFDAIAAAELLIMPSYFESLSMVALEAWALGKPVLANGRCDVLKGQCIRSNGGLYYDSFEEFIETLRAIDMNRLLALALGRNGREFFRRHYAWPIVERTYLDMLQTLAQTAPAGELEPLPGWFARRRNDCPPADAVVAKLPTGAVVRDQRSAAGAGRPAMTSGQPPATRDERAEARDERPAPAEPAAPMRREPAAAGARPPRGGDRPQSPHRSARPPGTRPPGDRSSQQRPQPGQGGERRRDARGPQRQRRRPGGRPPRRPGNR